MSLGPDQQPGDHQPDLAPQAPRPSRRLDTILIVIGCLLAAIGAWLLVGAL